ncbi:putative haloacid dehalogenase [Chloropicon primus]|uniref:Putative haloacid dehalogenase n=1 Tax=Chloropicon primus TaxID=1764295 RepID=A0A5B8N220_9CHLO|nr:putative haloacid dehalogenase [Chloropicon primus]UPR05101.1 putative haloacid dehalogenase [Chloropicon primus]|mmetsp:Transcript_10011/g.28418  ORF Transcript_10011/g.28418 Transcript_10011/m.28418 type:complete len:247 (-) Transcript_10011:12-752(-)|eukprot:QDZ25900.1 putative haloacid dehalogenase [Chloropicon primus]
MILVTFDVDGTLIESEGLHANKLHKEAFSFGFKSVFGLETSIDEGVKHHGMTDPLIIQAVLEHHKLKVTQDTMKQVQDSMVTHALGAAKEADTGLRALEGTQELLDKLNSAGMIVALTTGNLEPIAWLKMDALGLKPSFSVPLVGGFGSDYWGGDISKGGEDRAQLLRIARKRAGDVAAHFHFGDSPYDISAAELAGATPIGVTTGVFSEKELRDASKDPESLLVLESLRDADAILDFVASKSKNE